MPVKDFELGKAAYQKQEYAVALHHLEKAARDGNMTAAFYLGQIYHYDTGYYDLEKAFYWYSMAAEAGIDKAMFFTGQACLFACGIERDVKKGIEWLERSSHLVDSRIRLAQAYRGRFDPATTDPDKAFYYSQLAYEDEKAQQYPWALGGRSLIGVILLGECFEQGIGVEKDLDRAIALYEENADQDYVSCDKLGDLYADVIGNNDMAIAWYEKSVSIESRSEYAWNRVMELQRKQKKE